MLGFQSLSILPLLASLVLSPTRTWAAEEATHPDLFQLKPANFEKEISKGHWFVEHFSPWCIHCKHFMPTWLKLVHQAEEELPEVRLAQINCMEYGDLCDKNGIRGYPTIVLFEDGKIIEKYKGARELPDLMAYLKEHVHKEDAHDEHDEPHPDHHDPSDDIPATPPAPPSTAHLNPDGEVVILDKKTFAKTLEDGPAFVKFYAPWCGHCKKLAPIWTSLAMLMKGKTQIAEVNCDDEGSLCKSQGISGYPTLVYFSGGARSEYSGGRKLEQLKSFAEKASADALEPITSLSELTSHIHDEPVVYALLYATTSSPILPLIRSASTILLGHPKIYTSPLTSSSRSSFLTQYPTAKHAPYTLLAFKDGNSDTPTAVLPGKEGLSVEDVREWLLKNKLPSWLELTQDSFQSVMNAPSSPLVVVVPSNDKLEDKIEDKVKEMARAWREKTKGTGHAKGGKEVVWAYMDGERWRDWMKSMYGLTIDDDESQLSNVRVVVASHKDLIYYDTDPAGAQLTLGAPTAVYNALNAIAAGSLGYKHSENVVERVARGLNGKITALEEWVVEHPFKFVFFLVGGIALVFWALYKWIGNDAAQLERGDYYMKSKNGRLD